MSIVRRQI